MKRLLLSICGLMLLSVVATAQEAPKWKPNMEYRTQQTGDEQVYYSNKNGQRVTNYDDTIWYDAFDDPNTWLINNTSPDGWIISSTAQTWYFAQTSINSTSGGNYALLRPGNPNTNTATYHSIATATPIDISAYINQNLVISYEKYGARFVDTLKVQVSNDNTNWTTIYDNTDFPILNTAGGSITANPASDDLFVPMSIVNGNQLYIRFVWDADIAGQNAGVGYGWFIDDVGLYNVPSNDLVLDETAFFDNVRLLYSWYYGVMPKRQASNDQITFSATYHNRGSETQTNSHLELTVSGQESMVFTTDDVDVNPTQLADTAKTTTIYAPSSGPGTYTFTWDIVSDSVDEIPSNNSKVINMTVSEEDFSLPPLPVSSANIIGKGGYAQGAYELTQDYFFNVDDTIVSMGVAFDQEWSNVGGSFKLSLLDENEQIVTESNTYIAQSDMITGEMVYFPVNEQTIAAGAYEAKIEVYSDSLILVTCQDPIPPIEPAGPGTYFSRTTLSYGGGNYIEDMAYLTLRTKSDVNCNSSATVNAFVSVNEEKTAADIDITNIIGLTPPVFEYSWTGPDGFTDTDRDLADVESNGTYSVTVTDVNGCTASNAFDVSGLSVRTVVENKNVSIFPNPTSGNFNLNFEDAQGAYGITITNNIGQVVASRKVTVNGSSQMVKINNLNLSKGIYTVSIESFDGESTIENHKVIVE